MGGGRSRRHDDRVSSADPALLSRESPAHKIRTQNHSMDSKVTLGQFMTFLREADYKIDAERDGKPMTGYGKNGEIIESTAFVRGHRAGQRETTCGIMFRGTMPSHSVIG